MIIKPGLIRNQSLSHRLERRIFNIFEAGGYDGFIYDAEDPNLLFQDSARTIPVTAIGQQIGSITDESFNANHAIQTTSTSRPTWQTDVNNKYVSRFDGVDDCLTSVSGGGGSAGFFFCVSLKLTGGAGTNRSLFGDLITASISGYIVRISGTNQLIMFAGNGTTFTSNQSIATVNVGTTTYLTAWDDGTNLKTQVDGGIVRSVSRPVVLAGSSNYTICKEHLLSLYFFPGDLYRLVYVKNSALTPLQIATIQQWVKLGAGL